jgi:hypothetical protein
MQIIEKQAMLHKRILTGLCLECAVRRHDFKEVLVNGMSDDRFSDAPLPEAWIGGRRHRLLIPVGTQGAKCDECNRGVASIYLPIAE